MKKTILFICFALLAQAQFAQEATPKKKKKKSKEKTETGASNSSGRQMAPTLLTLHFISKGSGIDHAAYDKVVAYTNEQPKKPAFTETQQGREGEKKLTFTLTELTPEEQTSFVQGIQNLVNGNDRVLVDTKVKTKKVAVAGETPVAGQLGAAEGVKTRMVISFISKGAGIDAKEYEKIKAYIDNHPKKPAYEVRNWGREGEKDFLLNLKELTPNEQELFVQEIKKLISSPEMVHIRENENYVKKGR